MLGRLRPPTHTRFDLLVVGGGIHGLFVALEAATRGLSVVVVERDDFGSGLSFNHQRTVHGGLRALESGRFDKATRQIAERRAWAVMAPHLLRPLPFLLPTRHGLKRSRSVIGAGLRVYDWCGRHRNDGLPEELRLPASRIVEPDAVVRMFPDVDTRGLTGGACWYDYQVRHPDRLNWLVANAAERAGASLHNHTEAVAALRERGRVLGVAARDVLTGETFDIQARTTIVCAGGAVPAVHAALGLTGAPLLLRACNLLVARPSPAMALAAVGRSGRTLTATPWSDRWLVGTFQTDAPVAPNAPGPSAEDVEAMLDDANSAFPGVRLTSRDVLLVHRGLVPAIERRGRAELMPEHVVIDHSRERQAGIFTLIGVKFTTARLAAIDALHQMGLAASGVHPGQDSFEPQQLLHGAAVNALASLQTASVECDVDIDEDIAAHLVDWYATEAADVVRVAAAAGRTQRLAPGSPVMEGEVVHAVERGRARRLADVVLRRTRLGGAGHPGPVALAKAADLLAELLQWSAQQRADEIARVEARYSLG